jgi:hypothetical protein
VEHKQKATDQNKTGAKRPEAQVDQKKEPEEGDPETEKCREKDPEGTEEEDDEDDEDERYQDGRGDPYSAQFYWRSPEPTESHEGEKGGQEAEEEQSKPIGIRFEAQSGMIEVPEGMKERTLWNKIS